MVKSEPATWPQLRRAGESSHVPSQDVRKAIEPKKNDAAVQVSGAGLTSQESGGLEIFGLQSRGTGGEGPGERQSSIDTEPTTLDTSCMRHAKRSAVEVLQTYDATEALEIFLKDVRDDDLRHEVLLDASENQIESYVPEPDKLSPQISKYISEYTKSMGTS